MKFITESELRNTFAGTPFTEYYLQENTRLTPEARQFLVDRKVSVLEKAEKQDNDKAVFLNERIVQGCQTLFSLFIFLISLMLEKDMQYAEELIRLFDHLERVQLAYDTNQAIPNFVGDSPLNAEAAGCPKHVSAFQILQGKGREVSILNLLQTHLKMFLTDLERQKKSLCDERFEQLSFEYTAVYHEVVRLLDKVIRGKSDDES